MSIGYYYFYKFLFIIFILAHRKKIHQILGLGTGHKRPQKYMWNAVPLQIVKFYCILVVI